MRILLIGGFGYIGSTLVGTILGAGRGDSVAILDALEHRLDPHYFHDTLNDDRVAFVKGDVSNMRLTWDMVRRADAVVYLASLTLPNSAKEPGDAILINRHMAEIVGDCCKKLGKRMVFMSTCSNYGKSERPVDEDGELLPVSIYAISKVDAEKYLLRNVPDVTVLRCATAYGAGTGVTRWDVLLNDFVATALGSGRIEVFQPNACRPICHVRDIARAVHLACTGAPEGAAVYNVGSNEQNYTKGDLAGMVAEKTGAEVRTVEREDKRDYRVDFGKISRDMGYRTEETPESALGPLIELWKRKE